MEESIKKGRKCPYCEGASTFVDGKEIYGQHTNYGMFYLCKTCNAYVGVHKGTDVALGRLANAELRRWKQKAHNALDELWKDKPNWKAERRKAYSWIAQELKLVEGEAHIGLFDIEQCRMVEKICAERKKKLLREILGLQESSKRKNHFSGPYLPPTRQVTNSGIAKVVDQSTGIGILLWIISLFLFFFKDFRSFILSDFPWNLVSYISFFAIQVLRMLQANDWNRSSMSSGEREWRMSKGLFDEMDYMGPGADYSNQFWNFLYFLISAISLVSFFL
jgi:hypothetical protein